MAYHELKLQMKNEWGYSGPPLWVSKVYEKIIIFSWEHHGRQMFLPEQVNNGTIEPKILTRISL